MITAIIVVICSVARQDHCRLDIVDLAEPAAICPPVVPPAELLARGERVVIWRCIDGR